MELEGKVILDLGITSGTSKAGNTWKKREVVIETFSNFPRKVKLTLFGERADNVKADVGMSYSFSIEIDSREYMGRWYTDVSAFTSRPLGEQLPPQGVNNYEGQPVPGVMEQTTTETITTTTSAPSDPFGSSDSDDLPF